MNSLSVVGSSVSVLYVMPCRDIHTHPGFRELYQKLDSLEQKKRTLNDHSRDHEREERHEDA